jgi:hypothetical protein
MFLNKQPTTRHSKPRRERSQKEKAEKILRRAHIHEIIINDCAPFFTIKKPRRRGKKKEKNEGGERGESKNGIMIE